MLVRDERPLPCGSAGSSSSIWRIGIDGQRAFQRSARRSWSDWRDSKATIRLIDSILANPDSALQGTRKTVIATVGKTTELVNFLEDAKGKVDGAKGAIAGWPGRKAQLQREIAMTRDNVRINENNYTSQARLLESTEAALAQKKTQIDGFRRLAERRLLSSLELGTEEERFRAAEANAAEARRRVEQMELDISNQKLKLAELESKIDTEPLGREGALRQAENNFRQNLRAAASGRREPRESKPGARSHAQVHGDAPEARGESGLTHVGDDAGVGIVAEMKIANAGELVIVGQMVATVVPEGVPLVVEAAVSNRDVGFVKPGIEGRVKVEAYPFQQFGTLRGRVRTVLPGLGRDNNFIVRLELLGHALPPAIHRCLFFRVWRWTQNSLLRASGSSR